MSTKKQKKPKQKTVSLQEFTASLEPSIPSSGQNVIYAPKKPMISSWADEVEEYELITEKERILLPSAPRASRGPAYEDSQIPRVPPYKAHLGNISYDIDDEDVFRFFNGLEVGELRLPRDSNNRLRGFGYVEFRNREDLIEALIMNEQMLRGRPLRISLGIAHGEGGGDNARGGRGPTVDETPADWRAGGGGLDRASDFGKGQNFYPRTDYGGGNRRDFGSKSDFYNRRSDFGRTHDYGRSKTSYDRPPSSGGYSNDYYGGDGGRGDNGPPRIRIAPRSDYDQHRPHIRDYGYSGGNFGGFRSFYGGNERERDRGDYFRPQSQNGEESMSTWRHDTPPPQRNSPREPPPLFSNDSRQPMSTNVTHRQASRVESVPPEHMPLKSPNPPPSPPRERKKLVLQPRSKTTSEPESASPTTTSAIFGGARPVDTAAREREIEKKLSEMNLLETKKLRLLQRPKPEVYPPVDFVQKKQDTSQRFRRDSNSRPHPPPLMAEPSSPPRLFSNPFTTRREEPRRRRSDEIDRDKDTNSEPEDDRDLRFIEFHRVDRKGRHDAGRELPSAAGESWRGNRGGSARGSGGDRSRVN